MNSAQSAHDAFERSVVEVDAVRAEIAEQEGKVKLLAMGHPVTSEVADAPEKWLELREYVVAKLVTQNAHAVAKFATVGTAVILNTLSLAFTRRTSGAARMLMREAFPVDINRVRSVVAAYEEQHGPIDPRKLMVIPGQKPVSERLDEMIRGHHTVTNLRPGLTALEENLGRRIASVIGRSLDDVDPAVLGRDKAAIDEARLVLRAATEPKVADAETGGLTEELAAEKVSPDAQRGSTEQPAAETPRAPAVGPSSAADTDGGLRP